MDVVGTGKVRRVKRRRRGHCEGGGGGGGTLAMRFGFTKGYKIQGAIP